MTKEEYLIKKLSMELADSRIKIAELEFVNISLNEKIESLQNNELPQDEE